MGIPTHQAAVDMGGLQVTENELCYDDLGIF